MADIGASNWNETDASNTTAAPDGAPEGMAPSGVNDVLRAHQGAIKRWFSHTIPKTTAGTSTAYTLTYTVAPGALVDGMTHLVQFHTANGAAPTLNVNALGAKAIYSYQSGTWAAVASGVVTANMICRVTYHSSSGTYRITSVSVPPEAVAISVTAVRIQKFTANGTYTPDAKLLYAQIECWGGGGGGGGAAGGSGGFGTAAGGGGAGGYSRTVSSATTIGASQTVTIGTAGTAGSAGANNGGNGGDTSVGSLCIAKGGSGSSGASSATGTNGGAGGIAGTGDVTSAGQSGFAGLSLSAAVSSPLAGAGGSTSIGAGGKANLGSAVGNAGDKGGGGSGGSSSDGSAAQAGAAGGAGYVLITEYCWG